jgi:hypothetical protein
VTAYTTLQSDYGKFIILDDASAIAVSLSVGSSAPAITVPWYAVFLNFGAGTATLTPITGTISYQGNLAAASMPVAQGSAATVAYDGTDFWAEVTPLVGAVVTQIIAGTNVTISPTSGVGAVTVNSVVPAPTLTTLGGVEAIAAVSHEWINSISTDGVPQLSQPAIADISGLSDELALLAPLASPALTGIPTAPTATAGTDTTQIATTAFVETSVSTVSGDVTAETARAEAAEALLAPKASPTFTGTISGALETLSGSITSPIVYGGSSAGSTLTLDGTSNGSPSSAYVLINSSSQGNVGIGLTNPFTTFHVNATAGTPASSGNVNTGIVISSSTGGPSLNLGNSNSSGAHYSWVQSAYVNSAGTTEPLVFQQIGGNVGIGTTTPHSPLAVIGLPIYASNAAAITGGLAAGDFFRTGADPDPVCVVH